MHKMHDRFCTEVRWGLEEGDELPFKIDGDYFLILIDEGGPNINVPDVLKKIYLFTNH